MLNISETLVVGVDINDTIPDIPVIMVTSRGPKGLDFVSKFVDAEAISVYSILTNRRVRVSMKDGVPTCPNCDMSIGTIKKARFCPHCGLRLDWGLVLSDKNINK